MFGSVIVMGALRLIWSMKSGMTEPLLHMTLPPGQFKSRIDPEVSRKEGDATARRQGTKVPKTEGMVTRTARRIGRLQPIEDKQDRDAFFL